MRVTIFKCVVAAKPLETELDRIAYMMQFSQELCTRTQTYRELASDHKKSVKKKAMDLKISRFPAFAPCAIMFGGKSRSDIIGLTDLCYLDIDKIEKETQIKEAMEMLRNDKHVVMASRSVSGKGLHILIRYQWKDWETPPQRVDMTTGKMQKLYEKVFDRLAEEYQQKLGMEMDKGARHIEHLYIVSFDQDMYYNPDAEAVVIGETSSEFQSAPDELH